MIRRRERLVGPYPHVVDHGQAAEQPANQGDVVDHAADHHRGVQPPERLGCAGPQSGVEQRSVAGPQPLPLF
jgi:hypothetical protein